MSVCVCAGPWAWKIVTHLPRLAGCQRRADSSFPCSVLPRLTVLSLRQEMPLLWLSLPCSTSASHPAVAPGTAVWSLPASSRGRPGPHSLPPCPAEPSAEPTAVSQADSLPDLGVTAPSRGLMEGFGGTGGCPLGGALPPLRPRISGSLVRNFFSTYLA